MKRSDLINKLIKIYESKPKNCSSYHIIDVLLRKAEREGMLPPLAIHEISNFGSVAFDNVWEEEEYENEEF